MNQLVSILLLVCLLPPAADAASLAEAKAAGRLSSAYLQQQVRNIRAETPKPRLAEFRAKVGPVLQKNCFQCHGEKRQKGKFRVDTLNPDLLHGEDVSWWLEVFDVLSNGEMPPEDEVKMAGSDRQAVVDWLSEELQVASEVRRHEKGHSSFRRMTRYEYTYSLQDLLGLQLDFGRDLPPETTSEDGFKNSSEMLQMSAKQFQHYRELGRKALQRATVNGERPVESHFAINLGETAKEELANKADAGKDNKKKRSKPSTVRTSAPHYLNRETGEPIANPRYNLRGRPNPSSDARPEIPPPTSFGLVLPGKGKATFNLGSELPDEGSLRVRVRVSRLATGDSPPRLRLYYGFQASNNSHATTEISKRDVQITESKFYEWKVPLDEINRNPFRGQRIAKVNSTESIVIANTNPKSSVFIDYIEVQSPAYDQWPPESHTRIFPDRSGGNEPDYARRVLSQFMVSAWRRDIAANELERKVDHYQKVRPGFERQEDALIEVLANVLASPNFLYLSQSAKPDQFELASRLSMFLWGSVPDVELLRLARNQQLDNSKQLELQVTRLLADPRARRFSRHYVRQWLGIDLLDYLEVDPKIYRQFNADVKQAMQDEPIAFFDEVLRRNESVIDFLHADYAMVNEALAGHYQTAKPVSGIKFQRVALDGFRRGGLLTQPGLLAMNSDGKDSHPLKRGIWLLEKILNDPPPPPPPSVPEIDLADPEIAKLTLKERMEDHRNDPACHSCHAQIDPWGIAFENFDAVGSWRDQIGKKPVDARATLFNREELNGIEGLKRHLLLNRQDQFARALVHKLAAYALGRPIAFSDHAELEKITAQLRQNGDGLATLITLLVTSDLFRN